ncbi:MAG: sensor histidine kinase [Lawsonibacter sp.]
MRKLRNSLPIRVGAWLLFLVMVSGAAFFGLQCVRGIQYQGADDARETGVFSQMVEEREQQVLELLSCQLRLKDNTLDYVARQTCQERLEQLGEQLDPGQTNFRYQVLSADGSQVLLGNLEEQSGLEALVSQIYYLRLSASGVSQMALESEVIPEFSAVETEEALIYSTPAAGAAEEMVVLHCGVLKPEQMEAQDEFLSLEQEFARCQKNFAFYLTLALSFAAAAAGAAVLPAVGLRAQAGGGGGCPGLAGSDLYRGVDPAACGWNGAAAGAADRVRESLDLGGVPGGQRAAGYAVYRRDRGHYRLGAAGGHISPDGHGAAESPGAGPDHPAVQGGELPVEALLCVFQELPLTWKTLLCFLLYLAAIFAADHLWPFRYWYPLPGAVVNLAVLMGLCWWSAGFGRVRKGTEIIAAGNLNHQIETAHLPADLRGHAEVLNNISDGLAASVNEQMKSERFKAELITNVSHDLKTPLTSIINYVDLLKATDQTDPRAQSYIEVLDRKSLRLKKLTEDLVEASKASTGVLAVNREKIGMAQLLDQALGEYEEKLEEKHLTVVRTVPEGESYVYADGRHLWRVIDNLLSNCAKYALEGTRVYIELVRGKGSVSLSVKNISREALNVPPERLMERFVRGEESRSTEGSGLGLSIARSLTELQGGTFELAVDGDLFKAVVTLPQSS